MIVKQSMCVLCALGFLGASSGLLTAHQVSGPPEVALAPKLEGNTNFGAAKSFNNPALPVLAGVVIEDDIKRMKKTKSVDGKNQKLPPAVQKKKQKLPPAVQKEK